MAEDGSMVPDDYWGDDGPGSIVGRLRKLEADVDNLNRRRTPRRPGMRELFDVEGGEIGNGQGYAYDMTVGRFKPRDYPADPEPPPPRAAVRCRGTLIADVVDFHTGGEFLIPFDDVEATGMVWNVALRAVEVGIADSYRIECRTKTAVFADVGGLENIHFYAHAVVNRQDGSAARIVDDDHPLVNLTPFAQAELSCKVSREVDLEVGDLVSFVIDVGGAPAGANLLGKADDPTGHYEQTWFDVKRAPLP